MSTVQSPAGPVSRAVPAGRPHRPLMLMVAAMALLVVVSAVGLVVDDRVLLGAPIWGKPLKFGLSFVVYGLTLVWLLTLPHRAGRWAWWTATLLAVTGVVDVGVVVVQAARGTFSHFNQAEDPVSAAVRSVFGIGVQGLMLANLVLAAILVFQRVGDRVTTRSIRAGMAFVIAGIGLGLLIPLRSTGRWSATDAAGHTIPLNARHSVGVPDGGPGLPLTGWSTIGGDLRIPHFVGLHGLQAMLIVALAVNLLAARVTRLHDEHVRASLVLVAAVAYAGLLALVTWQALRGQALIRPDGATLAALALLVTAAAAAGWAVLSSPRSP